jgi:hypothetical protein
MREVFKPSTDQTFALSSDPDKLLAYNLLIYYLNCEYHYFPVYNHTKFNDLKPVEKQSAFKYLFKFVKDKKGIFETSSDYYLFIKAQLEIAKLLESKNPIVNPSLLVGDKAEKRYYVWKKKVESNKMITKTIVRKLEDKFISSAFDMTICALKDTLGDNFTYDGFLRNINRIMLQIRAKQIDPIWCFVSEWVKQLPDEIKNEIISLTECEKYKDYNVDDIKKIYDEKFGNLS